MNKALLLNIAASICIFALSACTTVSPPATAVNQDPTAAATPLASNSEVSTLACGNGSGSAPRTPELTEGPYFTPDSPERTSLVEDGMAGTRIVITGYVYTTDCKPVADALLDFWQANAAGEYDNSGYTLRGHQFTDPSGRYELTTVVPGLYPGRTEHIHVKVQAPGGQLITSQLFFPGVSQNDSDGIFNQGLLLSVQESGEGLIGQFNFVIPAP